MELKGEIRVGYKYLDGWHIFSSKDVRGLYVASKSAEKAYADVGPSIETLLRLSTGQRMKVEPLLAFEEFMRHAIRQRIEHRVAKKSAPAAPVMRTQYYSVAVAA
jgi:hypothetical protein